MTAPDRCKCGHGESGHGETRCWNCKGDEPCRVFRPVAAPDDRCTCGHRPSDHTGLWKTGACRRCHCSLFKFRPVAAREAAPDDEPHKVELPPIDPELAALLRKKPGPFDEPVPVGDRPDAAEEAWQAWFYGLKSPSNLRAAFDAGWAAAREEQ